MEQRFKNVHFDDQKKEESAESLFMANITQYILNNIADVNLNSDVLSKEFSLSRTSLHRKLKAISSLSSGEFIRSVRLQKSAKELVETTKTISEISYDCGFNTPSYFSTCFTNHYKMTPKEYRVKNG